MAQQQDPQPEDEDEWEYEYSTTETETFYLTLDLSVRDFLERRPDNKVIHNTRGGYRVWFNPLFNAAEPRPDTCLNEDNLDDAEPPEREVRELDNIGLPQTAEEPPPQLEQAVTKEAHSTEEDPNQPIGEIQILDLHSDEPLVSYRNHVFRGTWYENIGTEMIFTRRDDKAPLPAIRSLDNRIDLLAASSARIYFKEATLIPKEDVAAAEAEMAQYANEEELPERYKRNGGVYIHVGGDKSGHRQPQAHFLEDLIALKRSRGEMDEVTVQPLETRHNALMMDDEAEERRRKKLLTDQERALRWRESRRSEAGYYEPVEISDAPPPGTGRGRGRGKGRGGWRGRGRRPIWLRQKQKGASSSSGLQGEEIS